MQKFRSRIKHSFRRAGKILFAILIVKKYIDNKFCTGLGY